MQKFSQPADFSSLSAPAAEPSETEESERHFVTACEWPISRRDFVKGAGLAIGSATIPMTRAGASPPPASESADVPLQLTINGERKELKIDARTSLLDLLREDLKMTGTKKGCDHGQCGACTVIADGRRINSCLALAISYDGSKVTTVEGLAGGDSLTPVQQAFLEHDGYQCGYCTPGQIVSATALMTEAHRGAPSFVTADLGKSGPIDLSADEVRERMSGNICRCGAYPGIVAAVLQAYTHGSESAISSPASFPADELVGQGGSRAAV